MSWAKHPTGDFHTLTITGALNYVRRDSDGALMLHLSAVGVSSQATWALRLDDEARAALLEALTTEPEAEVAADSERWWTAAYEADEADREGR